MGQLDRELIVTPRPQQAGQAADASEPYTPVAGGPQVFRVCRSVGVQVILDANGVAVDQSNFDGELLDYYAKNPGANPMAVVEATAQAEFATGAFRQPRVPDGSVTDICVDTELVQVDGIKASICLPKGWRQEPETDAGVGWMSPDGKLELGVFRPSITGTAGTRCATPAIVRLRGGDAKVCAFNPTPDGAQGHGIVLPSGRELGLNVLGTVDDAELSSAFAAAFSVEDVR